MTMTMKAALGPAPTQRKSRTVARLISAADWLPVVGVMLLLGVGAAMAVPLQAL